MFVGIVVVIAFAIGEVVGSNTMQAYAMDLAPADSRCYFLGTWQTTLNVGQLIDPLVLGGIATRDGLPSAFAIVATVLLASGAFVDMSPNSVDSCHAVHHRCLTSAWGNP